MTGIKIKEIVWDDWNKEHIKKHDLTVEEVECAVSNFLGHKNGNKGRYILIGRSGKRLLSIIIKRIDKCVYYIVTARDSDKKERRIAYGKEKPKNSEV